MSVRRYVPRRKPCVDMRCSGLLLWTQTGVAGYL